MNVDPYLDTALDDAVSFLRTANPRPSGLDVLHAYGLEEAVHDRVLAIFRRLARGSIGNWDPELYKRFALAESPEEKPLTRALICDLGRRSSLFEDHNVWLLYWATLLAQHRFSLLFCGSGSHEERLTGHLVSEIFAARDQLLRELRGLSWRWSGPGDSGIRGEIIRDRVNGIRADLAYADIACARQEAKTGGDLGLVVVRSRYGTPEYVPIRLQAKKADANGRARIAAREEEPRSQLDNLLASKIGFYLYFYPGAGDRGPLAPIVQSAEVADRIATRTLRVQTQKDGVDLATFVLEILTNERTLQAEESMADAVARIIAASDRKPGMVLALSGVAMPELHSELDNAVASYRDALVQPDEVDADDEENEAGEDRVK